MLEKVRTSPPCCQRLSSEPKMPDEHGRIDEDSIKAATGQFDLESVFKLTMSHMGIRTVENLSMCPNLTVCLLGC